MREHFVTLFNSKFLPQGVSLYSSMEEHIENFNLWVLCLDIDCFNLLKKLNFKNLTPVLLSDFETIDLLNVKTKRTFTEYCWTLTPFTFKFIFNLDIKIKRLTYIDADTFFFDNPQKIFNEMNVSKKNVLITPHNYSPFYDQSKTSGKYCVQFVSVERGQGQEIINDWEEKCIDWCFNRFEENKFGDQKYLDDWPIKFKDNVHVLYNKEYILAPWNVMSYSFHESIMFHFHGLRILKNSKFFIGNYIIPNTYYNNIYKPYLKSLKKSIDILEGLGYFDVIQQDNNFILKLKSFLSVPHFIFRLFKYKHIVKL
jgi:hypothetical protein